MTEFEERIHMVFYLLRRHRQIAPVFRAKFKKVFSDQYEVVAAFDDPEKANNEKKRRDAQGRGFRYSIGRVTV